MLRGQGQGVGFWTGEPSEITDSLKGVTPRLRVKALETFAVDDRRAGFLVFLLGNPHLLEGGERGQDGTANPHRVFTLWRGDDLATRDMNIFISKTGRSKLVLVQNTVINQISD